MKQAKILVFYNQDGLSQITVEKQVFITLQRLGTYGNKILLEKCLYWVKVEKGTIKLITWCVLIAINISTLHKNHYVWWPALGLKREDAKQ